MASGDVSLSKLAGPPRTKIIEEKIDSVRNMFEDKPNSSISLPTPASNSLPELVKTVERNAAIASIKIKSLLLFHQDHLSTN